MRFDQISPFVRYVQLLHIRPGEFPVLTCSYDCRLFYVYRGEGNVFVDGREYPVVYSDLFFWQSGTRYRMDVPQGEMQFLCVNFDLTGEYRQQDYPIPPVRHDLFNPEQAIPNIVFSDVPGLNAPVRLKNMAFVEDRLLEMKSEYVIRQIHWQKKVGSTLAGILCDVARHIALPGLPERQAFNRVLPVIRYIQEHFSEPVSHRMLGEKFNYHPNHLNRLMLASTGMTLYQYVLSCRIQKAIELLESETLSVTEIAHRTGFRDVSHFSKMFRQKTGSNPGRYRGVR